MAIVLVGCGSIGRHYKNAFIEKYNEHDLYIIDNKDSVLEELKKDKIKCFKNFDELKKENKEITYGVVANWGPDHISTAKKLIDMGCKRLIIEKPLSNRKDDLEDLKKRCLKEDIFITIHHHFAYTNIVEKIRQAEDKFNLGDPKGIRIIGGAVCLSTNGTHYFDLSNEILKTKPKHITAELELDYINPRDKKLLNIGGMAFYKMENNSFINVSFSNENSEACRVEIVYRNSLMQLGSDHKLKLYLRKMEDVEKFNDKITRCGELNFECDISYENVPSVDRIINNLFNQNVPIVDIEKAEISTLMVIGAIDSHIKGKRIYYDKIEDNGLMIS
tara:strand:- start:1041 stop:2036 length:996 start_codon:yes stop_codon:yes gene_type:complete